MKRSIKSEKPNQNSEMPQYDRLTALMTRFQLRVRPAALDRATLIVTAASDGTPDTAYLWSQETGFARDVPDVVLSAYVDWGGAANPLLAALPARVAFDLTHDTETQALVALMQSEFRAKRCGMDSVVNRLGEVLVVRMLRSQIETGSTEPGLLAGLSDPRLSRAIVAMHDQPGRIWRNDDLATIAGLSLSRFAETFLDIVGQTPAAYLRRWRLILAKQDISNGGRIDVIARRYGYQSAEGFSKAFKKQFGTAPISLRPNTPDW